MANGEDQYDNNPFLDDVEDIEYDSHLHNIRENNSKKELSEVEMNGASPLPDLTDIFDEKSDEDERENNYNEVAHKSNFNGDDSDGDEVHSADKNLSIDDDFDSYFNDDDFTNDEDNSPLTQDLTSETPEEFDEYFDFVNEDFGGENTANDNGENSSNEDSSPPPLKIDLSKIDDEYDDDEEESSDFSNYFGDDDYSFKVDLDKDTDEKSSKKSQSQSLLDSGDDDLDFEIDDEDDDDLPTNFDGDEVIVDGGVDEDESSGATKKPKKKKDNGDGDKKSFKDKFNEAKNQILSELKGEDNESPGKGKNKSNNDDEVNGGENDDEENSIEDDEAGGGRLPKPLTKIYTPIKGVYIKFIDFVYGLLVKILELLARIPGVNRVTNKILSLEKYLRIMIGLLPLFLLVFIMHSMNSGAVPKAKDYVYPDGGGSTITDVKIDGDKVTGTVKNTGDIIMDGSVKYTVYSTKPLSPLSWFKPSKITECDSNIVHIDSGKSVKVTATCKDNLNGLGKRASGEFVSSQ